MKSATNLMIGLGLAFAFGACTDTNSATNLNAAGPPMLRQVRMNSKTFNADGSSSTARVFGFGSHEQATADELKSNQVTHANAVNNTFRLIIDELLVGNNLEEIACRGAVDDDAFAKVPVGATPDDIARCSVADDVLPSSCAGPTAVCLCANAAGCISTTGVAIAEGAPVGVLDINQDGATDDTQFVAGAIGIQCGSGANLIDVPISVENSYWNPSGNQNKPAMGGFEALGPAVVLAPQTALPTNLPCTITVSDSIVDKQGIKMCAPPDGDVTQDCTPGDMSQFHFSTETLDVKPASFTSAQTGVSRGSPLVFASTAPLKASSTVAANITISPATVFTTNLMMPQVLIITPTAMLLADTLYTVTVTTNVTDTFNQPAPAAQVYTFTTGS